MTQAEKEPAKKPGRKVQIAQNILRLFLIALIIWVSYWAAKTVKRIAAGPQNPVPVQEPVNSNPPSFQALSESPEPGLWAFEQQDWALAQTKISPSEFENHLLNRLKSQTETSADGQNLLANFRHLGAPQAIGENGHLYRISSTGGPFAVSRGKGTDEQLVTAGFVMPEANGDWQLMEMLPAPNATRQNDVSAKSLLPLPPHARRLMSRWSNAGELILDWVHVPVSSADMIVEWRKSGLKLRKTAGIIGAESSYLYEQNGEVIIVNVFPSTEGGADLLISKSPDVQPLSEAGTKESTP
jgi:hypothetical protein